MSAFGDVEALTPGTVAVLTPNAEWRRVSMDAAGLTRDLHPEQQFALSPDGRRLALGDTNAVVILNLRTAASRTYATPAGEPVALAWAPDGHRLLFGDRNRRARGFVLDPTSGRVTTGGFAALASTPGPNEQVLELRGDKNTPTRVRIWSQDGSLVEADLEQEVKVMESPAWLQEGAFVQRYPKLPGGRSITGIVTFDVTSGKLTAVLPLRPNQLEFTKILGWADQGTVIVKVDSGRGGSLLAWSPGKRRLVQLCSFDAGGMQASPALRLVLRP